MSLRSIIHVTQFLCLTLVLPFLAACDWNHYAIMNSIPFHGDPSANPVVNVFIAVDGLSYQTLQDAIDSHGILLDNKWSIARSVAMFPATSDASWSRILRTPKIGGYEYAFYDAKKDKTVNDGFMGFATHGIPEFEGSPLRAPSYYAAFDYQSNGYLGTVWSYADSERTFHETLDNIFFLLDGQAETVNTFAAYMLDLDAMGHMQNQGDVKDGIASLFRRIEEFRHNHPEREFRFTVFSDHGMDRTVAQAEHLVDFRDIMKEHGVTPVKSFAAGRANNAADGGAAGGLYAIPILHTRVSYVGLHTPKKMAPKVAESCSKSLTVDLAVAHGKTDKQIDPENHMQWVGMWRDGVRLLRFAYNPVTDSYLLPQNGDYTGLDIPANALQFTADNDLGNGYFEFNDEELFAATIDLNYPDMFYRTRTGLLSVSIDNPADVLISFKRPYASIGFSLPGSSNSVRANSGFHGALDKGGSLGVMVSDSRTLPATVRADSFGKLFPAMLRHVQSKHLSLEDLAVGQSLDYNTLAQGTF